MKLRPLMVAAGLCVSSLAWGQQVTVEELGRQIQDLQRQLGQLQDMQRQLAGQQVLRQEAGAEAEVTDAMRAAADAKVKTMSDAEVKRLAEQELEEMARTSEDIFLLQGRLDEVAKVAEEGASLRMFGYGRSGFLLKQDGDGASQLSTNIFGPSNKHFRLGNEEDTFIEIGFRQFFKHSSGAWAKWQLRPSYFSESQNGVFNDDLAADDNRFTLSEAYAQIGGMDVIDPGMKAWAGRRYYSRHNLYINNFYLRHYAGTGGGLEDIPVGPGKLSLAAFSLDQGDFANSRQNPAPRSTEVECKTVHGMYDVTLGNTGIWKFEGAWHSAEHLEKLPAWDDNDADSGWQGGIVNTRLDYYGHREADTFTVSMLQYGKKIGSNLGQACEYLDFNRSLDDDSEAIRFATYGVRPLGSKWNVMTAFIAEKRWDYFSEGDDLNWVSIGGRLQYKWTRNFILNMEPGYQWVEDANDESGGVFKFTIAPTFKMDSDSFWSRPEVRFFMTYATWSDDIEDQIVQPNGAPLTWAANYTDNWTLNFGIQAEIFWDYD